MPLEPPTMISITTMITISFCETICTTFGLLSFASTFGYISVIIDQLSFRRCMIILSTASSKFTSMSVSSLFASKFSPVPPSKRSIIGNAMLGFISKMQFPSSGFIENTLKLVGLGKLIKNSPYVI